MGTDTNEVVTYVDSNVGVCASSINDAAGEHTHFLPALVLSLMRAAVVLVKALLVNSVSNEAYMDMIDQICPRESVPMEKVCGLVCPRYRSTGRPTHSDSSFDARHGFS